MFKRVLLSSAALAALTTAGFAADLPGRAAAPAPYYAPAPVFTWTGFYVGVNAGGGFNSNNSSNSNSFNGGFPALAGIATTVVPVPTAVSIVNNNSSNGNNNRGQFLGGGQIGYNLQFSQFVLGIEADIQGISRGNNNSNNGFQNTDSCFAATACAILHINGTNSNSIQNSNYFGTVRGRIGYAWDRFMVYGTGGFAYSGRGNNNNNNGGFTNFNNGSYINYINNTGAGAASTTYFNVTNPVVGNNNNSNNNVGYAVGGGIEYAFTNNLSLKAEYLYVNTNRNRNNNSTFINPNGVYTNTVNASIFTVAGATAGTVSGNNNRSGGLNVVRLGLNYRFGSPAPAVVAKY